MKLSEILGQYCLDTTKASDICRQSNYSLIVICWILANENISGLVNYKIVLFFVVFSLLFDFMQYFYRGIIEGKHYYDEESKAKNNLGKINEDYYAKLYPNTLNSISTIFYYVKILCTLIAFAILLWKLL